jgi:hypothetical protein
LREKLVKWRINEGKIKEFEENKGILGKIREFEGK